MNRNLHSAQDRAPADAGVHAKVLLLDTPGSPTWVPWGRDAQAALSRRHRLETLRSPESAIPQVSDPAVAVVIDPQMIAGPELAQAAAGHVRLWQLLSVGYDALDMVALSAHGIPVARCPGLTSARGLAEHALLLMLMVLRHYPEAARAVDAGTLRAPFGALLAGRTLLIVGLGASGQELAKVARALGMRVIAVRRGGSARTHRGDRNLAWIGEMEQLDDALPGADVVSLHVPLVEETRNILDRERISRMRPGSVIINVSRGGLVDEDALAEAVRSGRLDGAGLDVVDREPLDAHSPLRSLPTVVVTPHIAGQTVDTSRRRGRFAAINAGRVIRGLAPLCRIDHPSPPR